MYGSVALRWIAHCWNVCWAIAQPTPTGHELII